MPVQASRVFVSSLSHEGHSFSPILTERTHFTVVEGEALAEGALQSSAILGGGVRALREAGVCVVAGLAAAASPGGPVRDAVYKEFRNRIVDLAKAARPDGVFLELHGAMVTESLSDPEGDLLVALRSELGSDVPIACALDLHAHVTPRMLEVVDICLACKENPHSDLAEAGEKAAKLLLDVLEDRLRPITAAAWLPLITGHRIETGEGPLAEVHALRREALSDIPQLLDISICNTTAYLDAAGAGQCVTAIADRDTPTALTVVEELAAALWNRRYEFISTLTTLEEALAQAAKADTEQRPFVLGDQGDRVLAGAPGDGTYILSVIRDDWPSLRAVAPVTDPDAVVAAKSAGIGGAVRMGIGAKYSAGEMPIEAKWRVTNLSDGRYLQRGPYMAGEWAELGETAVLTCDNLTVIATSQPGRTQEPAAFLSNGVNPSGFDVVVMKSGFHFKLSFADIGTCMVVGTPGLSNYVPGLLTYRCRRPCFPEDAIELGSIEATIFR